MTERTVHYVKMAKAKPEEVETLRKFMSDLEEMINEYERTEVIGQWVIDNFPEWARTVEGYPILVENACDPTLSYLDWKPELKQLFEAAGIQPD